MLIMYSSQVQFELWICSNIVRFVKGRMKTTEGNQKHVIVTHAQSNIFVKTVYIKYCTVCHVKFAMELQYIGDPYSTSASKAVINSLLSCFCKTMTVPDMCPKQAKFTDQSPLIKGK